MSISDLFKSKPSRDDEGTAACDAEKYVAELVRLQNEKKLERPIDEYVTDSFFVELLQEYGTAAAVRIYDAEKRAEDARETGRQSAIDDFARMRSIPRPIRTGIHAEPETDFSKMSTDEFMKLKKRMAKGI